MPIRGYQIDAVLQMVLHMLLQNVFPYATGNVHVDSGRLDFCLDAFDVPLCELEHTRCHR